MREHSLRELGKRLEVTYGISMTREGIVLAENTPFAKVTQVFQTASIPDEMISAFPVISGISLSDYQFLLKLSKEVGHRKTLVKELMSRVR